MKTEGEIEEKIEDLEDTLAIGGNRHTLETMIKTLEWVLEYRYELYE